jgi:hypothetical protein
MGDARSGLLDDPDSLDTGNPREWKCLVQSRPHIDVVVVDADCRVPQAKLARA